MRKDSESLADANPELVREWDVLANEGLRPDQVASKSNKKRWWRCAAGHTWQATVYSRTSGTGCPYCSGRLATPIDNLAVINPQLASQWHPVRNVPLKPEDVRPNSSKKVWWQCAAGHEWKAVIGSRNQGYGCPYCAGQRATKANAISTLRPDLAQEWHPSRNGEITPKEVATNSQRKYWWVCSKGHEWQATPANRNIGRGCPVCAGEEIGVRRRKAALRKHGSFTKTKPALAGEWNAEKNVGLNPDAFPASSHRKVWWRCSKGHEWLASIQKRAAENTGCPYCTWQTSRLEIELFAELSALMDKVGWRHKIAGIEIDIWLPDFHLGVEVDGYPWHSGKDEKDKAKNRKLKQHGIELLRVRDVRNGRLFDTDVLFSDKEPTAEVAVRLATQLLDRLRSRLSAPQVDTLSIYISQRSLINSEKASEMRADLPLPPAGESLADVRPDLMREWNYDKNAGLNPSMFLPQSNISVWWQCDRGHEWEAKINNRYNGRGCPLCKPVKTAVRILAEGVQKHGSLAEKRPDVAKLFDLEANAPLTPDTISHTSSKQCWWMCSNNHKWRKSILAMCSNPYCPECQKQENNLSITKILSWADEHYRLTGKWPTNRSGKVIGSTAEVWGNIGSALARGDRGLPGGTTLSKVLGENRGVSIRRRQRSPAAVLK